MCSSDLTMVTMGERRGQGPVIMWLFTKPHTVVPSVRLLTDHPDDEGNFAEAQCQYEDEVNEPWSIPVSVAKEFV